MVWYNQKDYPKIRALFPALCHWSNQNQPRKVELNQPPAFHRRNKHFRSKKLHSRALQGDFGNENADLRDLTGRFISTLAGRFQVTADRHCLNFMMSGSTMPRRGSVGSRHTESRWLG